MHDILKDRLTSVLPRFKFGIYKHKYRTTFVEVTQTDCVHETGRPFEIQWMTDTNYAIDKIIRYMKSVKSVLQKIN